jgi:hypothetical protein
MPPEEKISIELIRNEWDLLDFAIGVTGFWSIPVSGLYCPQIGSSSSSWCVYGDSLLP